MLVRVIIGAAMLMPPPRCTRKEPEAVSIPAGPLTPVGPLTPAIRINPAIL